MSELIPLSEERSKEIVAALESKKVKAICPMCNNDKFQLAPGYFVNVIQNATQEIELSGPSIPVAVLLCNNCGFVSQHSLGKLGLLSEDAAEEVDA